MINPIILNMKNNKEKKIKKGVLIAFDGEIFLKSFGVKNFFKKKLVYNILNSFQKQKINFKIFNYYDRIFIEVDFFKKAMKVLKKTFGIAWYTEALFLENCNIKDLNEFIKEKYINWIKKDESFALRVKKEAGEKQSKEEIIKILAKNIKRKVNLSHPDKEIFIEIRKNGCFLYFKKNEGLRGMPIGSQGKVLVLMSGGIDSPVANWLINKRGTENIWIHFHSFPLVSEKSIEKIKDLARLFLDYQSKIKIYFVPFSEIQTEIKLNIPAKYRVLFYRRAMFKISEQIAKKENYQAIITGESLGQVSSQTLQNINIIQEKIKIPILRPLISFNKEEIIKISKKIKTYEISILPQEDCCTLFVPKGQSAKADINIIKNLEKKLNLSSLIKKAIKNTKLEEF